ncbi:protein phosphatase 2C 29-like isoform X2 [Amaranthus tricolor]|uniref:protein phosphatase 2C 29-like isoform X2 n=1 Tax=Amaranthus tricolor TaxID=29722 RepID=UPI00258DB441|nr:protein phosphatase 2C 29-like isoform X2 [Amaranthus tricolor]
MGSGFSHLIPCLKPDYYNNNHTLKTDENSTHIHLGTHPDPVLFTAEQPLDETLGHSFCYVRSSARFLSPTSSDHFLSPSHSLRFDDRSDPIRSTGFRTISGASVSANTSTPRTVEVETSSSLVYGSNSIVNGFDCTSSFAAIPLQPAPRGGDKDNSGFFLSGPIERGALSGPLDSGRVPFSAPLGGAYKTKKKKKKTFKKLYRSLSEKKRQWVVPVVGRKEKENVLEEGDAERRREENVLEEGSNVNVQWALGKAGEDRVHVVVSEELGWLFVGIYDGFNGPDAPEFLMGHLYKAVFGELKGLFWDTDDNNDIVVSEGVSDCGKNGGEIVNADDDSEINRGGEGSVVKRVTFEAELDRKEVIRRKLWEFLAEDEADDGLDLSGSDRFAFSVDDAVSVSNAASGVSRRSLLLSKLKQGLGRSKDGGHTRGGLFQWRFGVEKDKVDSVEEGNRVQEEIARKNGRRRKTGPVDHELVLRALSLALEKTEGAYLDLTEKVIDRYPELALMGSCLLVVLMRDEDVYVMNLGDSRAIVAQLEPQESCSDVGCKEKTECESSTEGIIEECADSGEKLSSVADEIPLEAMKLMALQLSTDHSTNVDEEVLRIKSEHPNDNQCIVNDRVKGRLKVTRAFGAGFLKQARFNDSLLEMFRNKFIGDAPYVSCIPSLRHLKLGRRDQFLVLSSDGLYQFFSNQEVVSFVENFLEKYPDGDPAQHLIEELLNRAAKKAVEVRD